MRVATEEPHESPRGMLGHGRVRSFGKNSHAEDASQRHYMEEFEKHDICSASDRAGTGKSTIRRSHGRERAVTKQVNRIILARPAVEAGERLGLSAGLFSRRSIVHAAVYDALYDIAGRGQTGPFLGEGIIEVAPLGVHAGRTTDNSFVILDESAEHYQRANEDVPHAGWGSLQAVITGDCDANRLAARKKIRLGRSAGSCGSRGIGVVQFGEKDVVRTTWCSRSSAPMKSMM